MTNTRKANKQNTFKKIENLSSLNKYWFSIEHDAGDFIVKVYAETEEIAKLTSCREFKRFGVQPTDLSSLSYAGEIICDTDKDYRKNLKPEYNE